MIDCPVKCMLLFSEAQVNVIWEAENFWYFCLKNETIHQLSKLSIIQLIYQSNDNSSSEVLAGVWVSCTVEVSKGPHKDFLLQRSSVD